MFGRVLSQVPSRAVGLTVTVVAITTAILALPIGAAYGASTFTPGNLLVSTSVWTTNASITAGTTQLPPNCGGTTYPDAPCVTAQAGGSYPTVFNNDGTDASFGVTQPIVIDQITPSGTPVSQVTLPYSTQAGSTSDQMVTSFSSKSELALNLSTDDQYVDFMGYVAPSGAVDVSNSDTPGALDHTNTDSATPTYRAVAQMDQYGNTQFTETNAYSGNNGRAAVLNSAANTIYTAGNGGNGSNPEPQGVVTGTGSQILPQVNTAESSQSPGAPTALGNFNITQTGVAADKSAKDDNFRGLSLYNNVIYLTKGSGSNGVDTVYFVDTTGTACPGGSNGQGLPSSSAALPQEGSFTSPAFSTSNSALGLTASNPGLAPTNTCILKGFPSASAKNASDATDYPFGIWFANPTTLYVADEGAGDNAYSSSTNSYTAAAASTTAGLQKWVFNSATGSWQLAYTLQNGLNLGTPYTVPGYPTGNNSYTNSKGATVSGPWAPATDGLRNLTGQVNPDGTVTLYASTSTVSFAGDEGADPNALVSITDNVGATTLPSGESFSTVMSPTSGQVIRGVSFVPVTQPGDALPEVPWLPAMPIVGALVGGGFFVWHRRFRTASSM
jgi:hypothetical protein